MSHNICNDNKTMPVGVHINASKLSWLVNQMNNCEMAWTISMTSPADVESAQLWRYKLSSYQAVVNAFALPIDCEFRDFSFGRCVVWYVKEV